MHAQKRLPQKQHEHRQRNARDDPRRTARSGAAAVEIIGGYVLHRFDSACLDAEDFIEIRGHEWPLLDPRDHG